VIVGSSVGAAVGAVAAYGMPAAEIGAIFASLRWPKLIQLSSILDTLSFLDTMPLEKFVAKVTGRATIEDLPVRYAAVACDLLTGERIVIDHGPVARAVRASTAIPALFSPVKDGDRLLVDGGVVDNLPARAARDLGADYVIAVDVLPPPLGKRKPAHMIDVIMLETSIRSAATHPDPSEVDCYLAPDVAAMTLSDFRDSKALMAKGREAMESVIDGVLRDLGRGGERSPKRPAPPTSSPAPPFPDGTCSS